MPGGGGRLPPATCTMMTTGGAGRWCEPPIFPSPKASTAGTGSTGLSFRNLGVRAAARVSRHGPRSQVPEAGESPSLHRDAARDLGSCSPEPGAGAGVGTVRTPGPGGRRGAAWGAGRGRRPFKPARPLGGPQPGTAPSGGRAVRSGGRALRGGAYWAPPFPGTPRDHRRKVVFRTRGLLGRGLLAPTRAGAGLGFQHEPTLPLAQWSRGFLCAADPPAGPDLSRLSLAWPLDRPNCSVVPSPAPSGDGG